MLRTMLALLFIAFVAWPLRTSAAGLEGKPAPLVELTARDGTPHALATIAADKPVVVVFWASWCPYCKALLPELAKRIAARGGSERVAVVAINVFEEAQADARAYIDANPFPFVWLMKGSKTAKAWKVRGTPGLFLVAKGGIVRYDRAARPLRPDATAQPVGTATSPAKTAMRWLVDLERELDAELAR